MVNNPNGVGGWQPGHAPQQVEAFADGSFASAAMKASMPAAYSNNTAGIDRVRFILIMDAVESELIRPDEQFSMRPNEHELRHRWRQRASLRSLMLKLLES